MIDYTSKLRFTIAAEGVEAVVAEALVALAVELISMDTGLGYVGITAEAVVTETLDRLVAQAVESSFVDTGLGPVGIAASQVVDLAYCQAAGLPLTLLNVLVDMLRVVLHAATI